VFVNVLFDQMNDFVNKRVDVMLLEMKFLKLAMLFCGFWPWHI
jgi:hypothetical protein